MCIRDRTIEAILRDTRFYDLLLGFDRQIAEAAHAGRCPKCGAALHWGSWERKPRGGPVGLELRHRLRFSLCCAADGCRKRETPGALRFLGRKVYFGAMVVLISAMQSGLNPERMKRLKTLVGVSRRTVLRWRDWWHTVFAMSPFWRAHCGFAPAAREAEMCIRDRRTLEHLGPTGFDMGCETAGAYRGAGSSLNYLQTYSCQSRQLRSSRLNRG